MGRGEQAIDPNQPVARTVVRLAWPAIMVSLLQTFVYLADSVMLGQYDRDALASMQVSGPVLWSLFSVFMGATVGTVALVARAAGEQRPERASAVARVALRLGAGLGLLVGLAGLVGTPWIVRVMSPDAGVSALAEQYMRIAFAGYPSACVATVAAMVLNGSGDTKTPFWSGLVTNTLNFGINYVLIFGLDLGPVAIPELGTAGAAAGTAIAFTVEAGILLAVLAGSSRSVNAGGWWRTPRPGDRQVRGELVRLSAPALLERVVVHAGFLSFARVIAELGPLAMATNQALIGLESICFLGAEGFGVAAGTVVGQFLGLGQQERAAHGGWIATGLCALTLTLCGVTVWLTAPWTLQLFADEGASAAALITEGLRAVPVLAAAQPLMACGVVLGHALRGAGDTRSPLIASFFGGLCVRVTGAWVLAHVAGLGVLGIWLATTLDWGLRTAMLGTVFIGGRWRHIQL